MTDIIVQLPAVALRGMVILPGMLVHFDISRPRSIHAIEQAMMEDEKIFLVAQRDPDTDEPTQEELYNIGTIAHIKQVIKMQGGIIRVLVEGEERAELGEILGGIAISSMNRTTLLTSQDMWKLHLIECII